MNEDALLDDLHYDLKAQERSAGVAESAAFLEANERKRLQREEKDAAALRLECLRLAVQFWVTRHDVKRTDVTDVAAHFERHVTGRKD